MKTLREIKEYFTFSSTERNGIIILSTIMVIILLIYFLIPVFSSSTHFNPSEPENKINELYKHIDTTDKQGQNTNHIADSLFPFDPNNLFVEEWKKLRLSEDQISVIINYKKAGGKFFIKEDLKKIYSISDDMYTKLEPYINLPKKTEPRETSQNTTISQTEINTADSVSLLKLPGIGHVFAGRIIKYRNLLGGFYDKNQLLEVYGFDSSYFNQVKDFITIDSNLIKKININIAKFREIIKHPYISYELTKAIVNERHKLLTAKSFKEMVIITTESDSLFLKLGHYVTF